MYSVQVQQNWNKDAIVYNVLSGTSAAEPDQGWMTNPLQRYNHPSSAATFHR